VATHLDCEDDREVPTSQGQLWAKNRGIKAVEASSTSLQNVKEFFLEFVDLVVLKSNNSKVQNPVRLCADLASYSYRLPIQGLSFLTTSAAAAADAASDTGNLLVSGIAKIALTSNEKSFACFSSSFSSVCCVNSFFQRRSPYTD